MSIGKISGGSYNLYQSSPFMKKPHNSFLSTTRVVWLTALLTAGIQAPAAQLINFPFNEGTGLSATDTATGLIGWFGPYQDPAVSFVSLIDASPSGATGDRSATNSGTAFLLSDDSVGPLLNITNQPLTIEAWVFIDPFRTVPSAEGIAAYGGSWKMGLRGGYQVFTLFGIIDITNTIAGTIPGGIWTHLGASWEPGAGVHFFVNGIEYFEPNTNTAARPVTHNYLSIGSEGFGVNIVAAIDRFQIHKGLLTEATVDSEPMNPKPLTANTLVAYNFDDAALPAQSVTTPARPAFPSGPTVAAMEGPVWTNDTPTGAATDFALSFVRTNTRVKEYMTVRYGTNIINLGANNTNYTLQAWVKLPTGPMEERRVIYRSDGPAPRIALSINSDRTMHSTMLGTADWTTSVGIPNDGRWHHIGVVMNDFTSLNFYLDGIMRQTVNRTQTGTASSGGTAGLTIGKESETRYFRGLLDRVMLHNEALADGALDYPALPGLATFDTLASHPVGITTNAGATVEFIATPTSPTAATYQWRYRTNLADEASIALAGQTTTTLTLNAITAEHQGYYFLVVTNGAGVSESYAARLKLTPDLSPKLFDFEAPTYVSGRLEEQDEWVNNQNGNTVRVLSGSEIATELTTTGRTPGVTTHSGPQAVMISGFGVASTTTRTITGLESASNVTLEVWVRGLGSGSTRFGTTNTFLTMENAAGVRAAAFRIGATNNIDYGTAITGVWRNSGKFWDENTWFKVTMRLDYATRTYDFLVDDVQVNTSPIAFYNANSDKFQRVLIFRGTTQSGMLIDDLNVTAPIGRPTLGIRKTTEGVSLFWPASVANYLLEATPSLTSPTWTTVTHTVVGQENVASQPTTTSPTFYRLRQNN
jgi:hypothetical protein